MVKNSFSRLIVYMLALLALVLSVFAAQNSVPTGPDTFQVGNSTYYTGGLNGTYIQAEAGNITNLVVAELTATRSWAGYYGNVTGTIVLNDGLNNTLYNWQLTSPNGEIYASNGSDVSWSLIKCVNYTGNMTGLADLYEPFNLTSLERFFGINETNQDGINETFNDTFNGNGLMVGQEPINQSQKCPMLYTFVDEAYQTVSFKEVLLHDNKSIIFASILNDSLDGFKADDEPMDFQMLVAEDGHVGAEATLTPYYFFVELA
ncbi:hypothetical protein HYU11_04665 [Candidatus Woesearchaeota archaeon]|nr:hypothetical protein [Candidatus Woesearchaeota archaeon]